MGVSAATLSASGQKSAATAGRQWFCRLDNVRSTSQVQPIEHTLRQTLLWIGYMITCSWGILQRAATRMRVIIREMIQLIALTAAQQPGASLGMAALVSPSAMGRGAGGLHFVGHCGLRLTSLLLLQCQFGGIQQGIVIQGILNTLVEWSRLVVVVAGFDRLISTCQSRISIVGPHHDDLFTHSPARLVLCRCRSRGS